MITIKKIEPSDFERWDRFIDETGKNSFHYKIRWRKFIEKQYQGLLIPVYLTALNKNEIQGVLPLFIFKHWFFAKKMISIPFSTQGGCLSLTGQAEELLIRQAIKITKSQNLEYLELRQYHENSISELITDNSYFTLQLKLENNFEQLQKKFRSTTRRYIRRSQEKELTVDLFSDDIEAFYKLYSTGQRNLGTPSPGYKWLKNLFYFFQENHQLALVRHKDKLIAGILWRVYKNTITYVIGASLPEYRKYYPNYRLFAALLEHCCKQGYDYFDFGRSLENSGTYYFKVGWGAQPVQFHYQYYLPYGKSIPSTSQANPKRVMLAKIWKKLPLPIANTLGPAIRRYFP